MIPTELLAIPSSILVLLSSYITSPTSLVSSSCEFSSTGSIGVMEAVAVGASVAATLGSSFRSLNFLGLPLQLSKKRLLILGFLLRFCFRKQLYKKQSQHTRRFFFVFRKAIILGCLVTSMSSFSGSVASFSYKM